MGREPSWAEGHLSCSDGRTQNGGHSTAGLGLLPGRCKGKLLHWHCQHTAGEHEEGIRGAEPHTPMGKSLHLGRDPQHPPQHQLSPPVADGWVGVLLSVQHPDPHPYQLSLECTSGRERHTHRSHTHKLCKLLSLTRTKLMWELQH